jgi:hypothetical protein
MNTEFPSERGSPLLLDPRQPFRFLLVSIFVVAFGAASPLPSRKLPTLFPQDEKKQSRSFRLQSLLRDDSASQYGDSSRSGLSSGHKNKVLSGSFALDYILELLRCQEQQLCIKGALFKLLANLFHCHLYIST